MLKYYTMANTENNDVNEFMHKLKSASQQAAKNAPYPEKEEWRKYYKIPGMQVSSKGRVNRYYGEDIGALVKKRPPTLLKPQMDKKGNVIIRTKDKGDLPLDRLVESCFHGTVYPIHRVIHKDGDKRNCCVDNLEKINIREYNRRFHAHDDWKEMFYPEDDIQLNVKTREVRQHGRILPVSNQLYDRDTDTHFLIPDSVELRVTNQYGKTNSERYIIRELVIAATDMGI